MSVYLPLKIGNVSRRTATQLAESAIDSIGELYRVRLIPIGVSMDVRGDVWIDRLPDTPPRELLMACTRKSDPDVLADNIRAEVGARG